MSFNSAKATVEAGIKAGAYKQAADDPYGFMAFADQVSYGVRANAEQQRKEDYLKKKEEAEERKALAKAQAAKEDADKKILGYVNAAFQNKINNYGKPITDMQGLNNLKKQFLVHVTDMGLTSFADIKSLANDINNPLFDSLFSVTPPDAAVKIKSLDDAGGGGDIGNVNQQTANALSESKVDSNEDAAASVAGEINETKSILGNTPQGVDLNTLELGNWENEIRRLEQEKSQTPNKMNYDEQISQIREYASSKGWVKIGGLTNNELLTMSVEELKNILGNMKGGVGTAVPPNEIGQLETILRVKEDIADGDEWFSKFDTILQKTISEPLYVEGYLVMLSGKSDAKSKERVENINNVKTIIKSIQSNQPLSSDALDSLLGKDPLFIQGFKDLYYKDADGPTKTKIDKLLSLSKEANKERRSAKEIAFDSWLARSGVEAGLKSDNSKVRAEAEKALAEWENAWAKSSRIADDKSWWENEKNVATLSLDEIENLLVMPSIKKNAAAQNVLLPVRDRLLNEQTANQVSQTEGDIIGLKTSADMDNWLLAKGNSGRLEKNPALQEQWLNQRANILSAENAADAEKNIDAYQQIWRNELGNRKLSELTSEEIAGIDKRAKELTSTEGDYKKRTYYRGGDTIEITDAEMQKEYEAMNPPWSPIKLGEVSQIMANLGVNAETAQSIKSGLFNVTTTYTGYPVVVNKLKPDQARPIDAGGSIDLNQSKKMVHEARIDVMGASPDNISGDTLAEGVMVAMSAADKQELVNSTKSLGFEQTMADLANPAAAFGPRGWGSGIVNKITGLGNSTFDEDSADAVASIKSLRLLTSLQIVSAFPGLRDSVNLRDSVLNRLPEPNKVWTSAEEARRDYSTIRDILRQQVTVADAIMSKKLQVRSTNYSAAVITKETLAPLIRVYDELLNGLEETQQVNDNSTLAVPNTFREEPVKKAPNISPTLEQFKASLLEKYPNTDLNTAKMSGGMSVEEYWQKTYGGNQ